MVHPLESQRTRTIARVVTLVAIILTASWYVVRAEGHADTATTAAEKADATAEALREEVRARIISDCEGTNDSRTIVRDAIVDSIILIGRYTSDPTEVEVIAKDIEATLKKQLPQRDCPKVAEAAIEAAEKAATEKEPA